MVDGFSLFFNFGRDQDVFNKTMLLCSFVFIHYITFAIRVMGVYMEGRSCDVI